MFEDLLQRELAAAADCEAIRDGLLGQPVNTITTLAFPIAAAVVARNPDRRWIAAGLAATGAGSALFHGPMIPGSEWAHDVSLAWLLAVVATDGAKHRSRTALLSMVGLGALLAAAPQADDPVFIGLTVAAIGRILWRDRSPRTLGALALLGGAAVLGRLSATGNPLCNPDSWLQGHGVWHVASAAAVAIWASKTSSDELRQVSWTSRGSAGSG